MALNNFTDKEAIEVCVGLRDRLPLDERLDLVHRWRDKDALAQVINLAEHSINEKAEKVVKKPYLIGKGNRLVGHIILEPSVAALLSLVLAEFDISFTEEPK